MKIHFTCSFDDGDIADIKLLDLLIKYQIKATFYVPEFCDVTKKNLTKIQIRTLSEFSEIGGHTMNHLVLTEISNKKAKSEINNCKKWLEDIIGSRVDTFCPPKGQFNKNHLSLIEQAGYRTVRTVEMIKNIINAKDNTQGLVILPTTMQVYNHTYQSYLKNIIKRFNFKSLFKLNKNYNSNWRKMGESYINNLLTETEINEGKSFFHLWGHSWEIDKFQLWEELENFFKNIRQKEGVEFYFNSELSRLIKQN